MYGRQSDKPCWEIDDTSCNHLAIQLRRDQLDGEKKQVACINARCIYLRAAMNRKGLMFECPFGQALESCPAKELAAMSLENRLESIQHLEEWELKEMISRHVSCMRYRELATK